MKGIWRSTLFERPFLPTAIIIDYFCEGGRLVDILRNVRRIVDRPGIELIIANAPEGADVRSELLALGADKVIQAEMEVEAETEAYPVGQTA